MVAIARRGNAAKEATENTGGRERRKGSVSRRSNVSWGTYDSNRVAAGDFNPKFSPDADVEHLLHFLDDAPIIFKQHWLGDLPKNTRKSYVCLNTAVDEDGTFLGEECPLCNIGDKATTQYLFNVIDLGPAEAKRINPKVMTWHITSVKVGDQIKMLSEARRTSPLNRDNLYWGVKWTQGNRQRTWTILPIKSDDIKESGWDMEPFTQQELDTWSEDGISEISDYIKIDDVDALYELIDEYDLS